MNAPKKELIEEGIQNFLADFTPSMEALMIAMNEAGISHYSSGCGVKSITFDLFPAASYISEFMSLLNLSRQHRPKPHHGFKDSSANSEGDPSQDFVNYLRRWTLFAEQVMQQEGASPRGVAAGRAKLIMADMSARLVETSPKAQPKTGRLQPLQPISEFRQLMRAIGIYLEEHDHKEKTQKKNGTHVDKQSNYLNALAAAKGAPPADKMSSGSAHPA